MVPIDIPSVFAIGAVIALGGWRRIKEDKPSPISRYVKASALYGLLWGASVAWFCINYPDWMWAYGVPITKWPVLWWYSGFVVALVLAAASGAMMAQAFISQGRTLFAWLTVVAGLFVLAVVWSVTWQPYVHLSTYADWHAPIRRAVPITSDARFQRAVSIVGIIQTVAGVGLVGKFLLEGRRGRVSSQ